MEYFSTAGTDFHCSRHARYDGDLNFFAEYYRQNSLVRRQNSMEQGGGKKGVESKQDQELEILSNTDHKDIPYRNLVVRNSSSYDSPSAKFRNENPNNYNPPFLSPVKFPRFHRLSFRVGSLRRPRFTNEPRYDARKYNPVIDLIIQISPLCRATLSRPRKISELRVADTYIHIYIFFLLVNQKAFQRGRWSYGEKNMPTRRFDENRYRS